ncbi:tryptophan 7-halogenase [Kitasatospora sp. NPDC051914]|uniref:NAD(P)/FAD-dependent oxidoreductase n=1 Tax=Kitasatospora sp. NPDC051914 TaxID=3154945 RepID=UPI0034374F4D
MNGSSSIGGAGIRRCDVLVAGSGPAGCAAALALARAGAEVLLVAPEGSPGWRVGESLAPTARPLLERLGVLDRLAGRHASCDGNLAAWGTDTLTAVDHRLGPYGEGWHLDRARFDAALLTAAQDCGAERYALRVRDARWEKDHWQVVTAEGDVLRAGCLVDATGRAARLARRIGATPTRYDRLIAVAGLLGPGNGAGGRERTSLVQSTHWGWWYTAPLPDGGRVVMALTDADLVPGLHLLDPVVWWDRAKQADHLWDRVAHHQGPPPRLRVLAAGSACTTPAAGAPGWAAVGDAATATDPLAARGILTAMATGLTAARAILADRAGDPDALAAYARRIAAVHAEYLRVQAAVYGRETRWDTVFWRRRHQGAGRTADRRPVATDR